ncbi:NF-X1-type zinc finger protein NFXL2, partial [Ananas comosus]
MTTPLTTSPMAMPTLPPLPSSAPSSPPTSAPPPTTTTPLTTTSPSSAPSSPPPPSSAAASLPASSASTPSAPPTRLVLLRLLHALFHLPCIQSWARQSLHLRSPDWPCPKCRSPYPKTLIPKSYFCFCGKVQDPPLDPWILPHSCGEICGRPLAGECGHTCLLLCHPGPCPPCPVLASSQCFCGRRADVRRCARRRFSCGEPCNKPLPCGSHRCPTTCHDGPCLPCACADLQMRLRAEEQERICAEREFRCERGRVADARMREARVRARCHAGACGACPLQGRRTCPCGKKEHLGLSCDAQVPTCGSTCGKMLGCGMHRCPERCHRGACVENCRIVVLKSCRCGSMKKEVPCYQDLTCERKCQRVRDCGRHACRRRCCGGDCPPCPEICDRKLRCNNHKCPSPCH